MIRYIVNKIKYIMNEIKSFFQETNHDNMQDYTHAGNNLAILIEHYESKRVRLNAQFNNNIGKCSILSDSTLSELQKCEAKLKMLRMLNRGNE